MKLLLEYIALCFFINNPNDLEPSRPFVWKVIGFYLVSGIVVEANIGDLPDATLEVALRAIIATIQIALLLLMIKQWPKFTQLLTAIFICENVMMTLGVGLEILDIFVHKTPYQEVPLYLGSALIIWYLAVLAYILRQTFSFKLFVSLLLATGYFIMAYGVPFLVMEVI